MGIRLIKISSLYFVVGVVLGMVMGMANSFQFISTHAHVNLLGWSSMTLFGLIYHSFPSITHNALAKVHFWLHNIGLPIMLLGLVCYALRYNALAVPLMSLGGVLVVIATVTFSINLWRNLHSSTN